MNRTYSPIYIDKCEFHVIVLFCCFFLPNRTWLNLVKMNVSFIINRGSEERLCLFDKSRPHFHRRRMTNEAFPYFNRNKKKTTKK
ncbi:hypothetical protein L1887_21709 [Cichorium endivia]|nr:hypothetical protein L1887_21709 [Cichorium endivia]